jgi:hypothetical protein
MLEMLLFPLDIVVSLFGACAINLLIRQYFKRRTEKPDMELPSPLVCGVCAKPFTFKGGATITSPIYCSPQCVRISRRRGMPIQVGSACIESGSITAVQATTSPPDPGPVQGSNDPAPIVIEKDADGKPYIERLEEEIIYTPPERVKRVLEL